MCQPSSNNAMPSEMSNVIHFRMLYIPNIHTYAYCTSHSFGYQTGQRTGLVLWAKTSLSGKGLGQGFLNLAEMMVLVVFLDSIVF